LLFIAKKTKCKILVDLNTDENKKISTINKLKLTSIKGIKNYDLIIFDLDQTDLQNNFTKA
jgi:hypothetical protein